jgi:serine/threonine protein kinase
MGFYVGYLCMGVFPEILKIEGKPTIFPYHVLKTATKNFNVGSKLGEGGFGAVYKVHRHLLCQQACCWQH